MKVSKESIIKDIYRLGINHGDTIYVAADLLMVGFFEKNRENTLRIWVDILTEVVGSQGTIIVAAYTDSFLRFKKNKNIIFNRNTSPNSGSLSTAFFNDVRSVRSKHPTHSLIGIGFNAHKILDGHDHHSLCYSPIGKIVELRGKYLMIGTVDKRNAPVTLHYAQECLGHTLHHPHSGLFQTYFKDDQGKTRLFTRYDVGGCTRGGYNLYGSLIVNDAVKFGYIGKGKSAVIDIKKSFDLIIDILKKNRKLVRCDDLHCISCYGRRYNNRLNVPLVCLYHLLRILKNKLIPPQAVIGYGDK